MRCLTSAERIVAANLFAVLLTGCGGDESDPSISTQPTMATRTAITVAAPMTAPAPHRAFVNLAATDVAHVAEVNYVVAPRPGTASRPVSVTYTMAALRRRGRVAANSVVTLPVIGLYAGYTNTAEIRFTFDDGSSQQLSVPITTPAAVADQVLERPHVLTARQRNASLGFDFLLAKPGRVAPVTIVDSDGYVRWSSQNPGSASVLFRDQGIDVGAEDAPILRREELDGATSEVRLDDAAVVRFHHNLEQGPRGLLAELDVVNRQEDVLAEIAPDGTRLKTWDMVAIISSYMVSKGDEYRQFTRPGPDWFHMNSAIYDPSDRSVIVSSRENFVIKLDYDSGEIRWILGDPAKHWYGYPSLRAKALTLPSDALAPIGQHSLSLVRDGELMMFNNGYESMNQPAGTPAGSSRGYSAVTAFRIDAAAMTARPSLTFDDGRSVYSSICSSAYLTGDGSMLLTYSHVGSGDVIRVVGLNPQRQTVFDLSYPTGFGCTTMWNSTVVSLEELRFE